MQTNRIQILFQKYYSKSITEIEREELFNLINSAQNYIHLESSLKENFDKTFDLEEFKNELDEEKIWKEIVKATNIKTQGARVKMLTRIAVAATILLLATFGIYQIYYANETIATNNSSNVVYDIPPGGNKAILTLADGKKVYLDTLSIGNSIVDGNTVITKMEDGKIVYETKSNLVASRRINIVETPKGGMFQISLPDGSQVWLNAMTKIKYPVNFDKTSRNIELDGEAYFEIAKDSKRPFIVNLGEGKNIRVLGTHFNTKSYNLNEMSTTVLEGKVGVNGYDKPQIILPNNKLEVQNNLTRIVRVADVNQNVAWKNGYFSQGEIAIDDLLHEISRWYDVEIENKENLNMEFVLNVKRNNSLQNLIKILELTKEIKFELNNKTLKVMSMNKH